jgi:glucose-1-phosphate cytidylyltransferase
VRRIREYVGNETFCLTYGDGVGDVDITALLNFHKAHGGMATLTAMQPPGRFGRLGLNAAGRIDTFEEKPIGEGGWVNGGFFVLEPGVIDLIAGDETTWEREPLESLAAQQQLHAFRHHGFWVPMDTLRDKKLLDDLWSSGKAPWKVWA